MAMNKCYVLFNNILMMHLIGINKRLCLKTKFQLQGQQCSWVTKERAQTVCSTYVSAKRT